MFQQFLNPCLFQLLLDEQLEQSMLNKVEKLHFSVDFISILFLFSTLKTSVHNSEVFSLDFCSAHPKIVPFLTLDCAGRYSKEKEEMRDFNYKQSKPFVSKDFFSSLNGLWRYQSASELDGYSIWAELSNYRGGDYVVDIFPKWDNKAFLDKLKNKKWIDRHTRAAIVEFTLFNAASNYFQPVVIVLEFPPGGGGIPYFLITIFRLYRLSRRYEIFSIVCEIGFLLKTVLLIIQKGKIIKREKC